MTFRLHRLVASALAIAFTISAHAAEVLACEGRSTGHGSGELVCPLAASAQAGHLRFQVRFSGVHDDSSAGLAAKLDGVPVRCGEGSTERIAGDAGGDALTCRIALGASRDAARKLVISLLWYHAEPVGYQLTREQEAR
jgi:hypothetical protein